MESQGSLEGFARLILSGIHCLPPDNSDSIHKLLMSHRVSDGSDMVYG